MTHLDLFSGIGGFALAAQWAGYQTVQFVEIDKFCQKVLAKHWPHVPIHNDIKDFDGTKYAGVDLLTGGSPCQGFSVAGKRRGKSDDRYLWPEMLRVIDESKANSVISENVAGIESMVLDQWCFDLESLGYEVQTFDISAACIGLPTMERHFWIVATSNSFRREGGVSITIPEQSKISRKLPRNDPRMFNRWAIPASRVYRSGEGIPNRVDRNRALGNAIVPQVAFEIIRRIAEIDSDPAGRDAATVAKSKGSLSPPSLKTNPEKINALLHEPIRPRLS